MLVYFAVSQYPIVDQHRFWSAQHLFGGIAMEDRDWIDRSVGRDEEVAFLWTTASTFAIWENEIFSRTVGDIYTTGPAVAGGLAQTPVSIDRSTGYVRGPDGRRVLVSHMLTGRNRGMPGGTVVGEDGSSAWFSIASTARCGSWHSSRGCIRRTHGRGSASRTRATSAPGAGSRSR